MAANDGVSLICADAVHEYCVRVFRKLDVAEEDAHITADVLVAADLRGVDSHGVARLRRYVHGLLNGKMLPHPDVQVIHETATTALIDDGAGLGQPISYRAMRKAIDKAQEFGTGFVTVRNSNHYGIAGHYAMMALDHDCIGISMTNAASSVVPAFGRKAMLGTNPVALAAPGGNERPYVLDMATSVVPECGISQVRNWGRRRTLATETETHLNLPAHVEFSKNGGCRNICRPRSVAVHSR